MSDQLKTKAHRNRLLRVPTLKPPLKPEGETCYIHYVSSAGKAYDKVECSTQVYDWLMAQSPWRKVHVDWVLSIDPGNNQVVHVTEAPRPSTMPSFNRVTEGKPPSKNVILTLHEDGSVRLREIPDRISDNTVTDIQNAVADFDGDIHAGSKVGKFTVVEKHEVMGAVELHVDPATA